MAGGIGKSGDGGFVGWSALGVLEADGGMPCRIYYRAERLWRRCGGGQGSACMSRKSDWGVAGTYSRLVLYLTKFHGIMSKRKRGQSNI